MTNEQLADLIRATSGNLAAAIKTGFAETEAKFDDLHGQVVHTYGEVMKTHTMIEELQEDVDARFDAVERDVTAIRQAIDLAEAVSNLVREGAEIKRRLDARGL
jgi:uncharacterized protein YceH (UPF0502 family)